MNATSTTAKTWTTVWRRGASQFPFPPLRRSRAECARARCAPLDTAAPPANNTRETYSCGAPANHFAPERSPRHAARQCKPNLHFQRNPSTCPFSPPIKTIWWEFARAQNRCIPTDKLHCAWPWMRYEHIYIYTSSLTIYVFRKHALSNINTYTFCTHTVRR